MLQVSCHRSNGGVDVTTVYLEATRMYFGGRRLWFRCPRCDGRCRVLYGTWRIACRRCHRLRYLSQRETKEDRATRAMLKIVRRLKPNDPDPCNDLPEKPPGMHWRTYDRLIERYEGYIEQWGLAILRRWHTARLTTLSGERWWCPQNHIEHGSSRGKQRHGEST